MSGVRGVNSEPALLSRVFKTVRELVANVIPHRAGDADPAGLGQSFQPCGDVDAIAVNIAAFGDHIAEIDTYAEGDPLILGDVGTAVDQRPAISPSLSAGGSPDSVIPSLPMM